MDSFKAIIDAIGVERLSEVFGVAESHVRVMRARDSIPPEYWSRVVSNSPDGVTFEALETLRRARFRKQANEPADSDGSQ